MPSPVAPSKRDSEAHLRLASATIGLSAFLLFLVQPLMAKLLLPTFGGSAAVWCTCLLFFQSVLVLGYLYAHALSKLSLKLQQCVHGALVVGAVAAGALFLRGVFGGTPLALSASAEPTQQLLSLLGSTILVPYFVLSTTSPLVSRWTQGVVSESRVYRLYALSNMASFAALLAYPFAVEPLLGTKAQVALFACGFIVYLGFVVALLKNVGGQTNQYAERIANNGGLVSATTARAAPMFDQVQWIVIPFTTGILLVSLTQYITTCIAPVPLLWVFPLALYLASYVVAFNTTSHRLSRKVFLGATTAVIVVTGYSLSMHGSALLRLLILGIVFFIVCLVLNGDLARRKPQGPAITHYYLSMSIGGALGTLICTVVAPRFFSTLVEVPLGLALVTIQGAIAFAERGKGPLRILSVAITGCLALLVLVGFGRLIERRDVLQRVRNFYGIVEIFEDSGQRVMMHAGILHGTQWTDVPRRRDPTSYYGSNGGVNLALRALEEKGPLAVGLVGLGAGTILRRARTEDHYVAFELDPHVLELYRTWFEPLAPPLGGAEFRLGDARLTLASMPDASFDMLVLDAFSGDAVPTHLLTTEAFALYERKLRHPGVLCVHITNSYLDLAPVVIGSSAALSMYSRVVHDPGDQNALRETWWVILADDPHFFEARGFTMKNPSTVSPVVWTDDSSSLFSIFTWVRASKN